MALGWDIGAIQIGGTHIGAVQYPGTRSLATHYVKITSQAPAASHTGGFTFVYDLSNLSSATYDDFWTDWDETTDHTKARVYSEDGSTRYAADWIDVDPTGKTGLVRFYMSSWTAATTFRIYPANSANASVAASDTYGSDNAYPDSWVGYYPDGGYTDHTSQGNDLTAAGSPTIGGATGQLGDATDYNGTNQVCEAATGMTGFSDGGRSIMCLVDSDETGTTNRMAAALGTSGGFAIGQRNGYVSVQRGNIAQVDSTTTFPTGWAHLAITHAHDSSNYPVYLDGSLDFTPTSDGFKTAAMVGIHVGSDRYSAWWDGKIQHVVITNDQLSADEVNDEYDQVTGNSSFWSTLGVFRDARSYNELFGLGGHTADSALEGFWPMQDSDANTTITDYSGNSATANLTGGANTEDSTITGPNSYLTSAIDLSATNAANVECTSATLSSGEFAAGLWIDLRNSTIHGYISQEATDGSGKSGFSRLSGKYLIHLASDSEDTGIAASTGTGWEMIGHTYDNSGTDDGQSWYINGTFGTRSETGTTGTLGTDKLLFGGMNGVADTDADICGGFYFSRHFAKNDFDIIAGGPEPVYTASTASLSAAGAWDVGTWGLPSPYASGTNGTITYEVELRDSDGTVLDAGTGSTGTFTETLTGGESLWVRASNSGSFDVGDDGYGWSEVVGVAPVVESTTTSASTGDATSGTIDLPATIDTGDLLLVLWVNDGTDQNPAITGYTQLDTENSHHAIFGRVADGTEGSTASWTMDAAEEFAAIVVRVSNWSGTLTDIDYTYGTSTTVKDPPSHTPSGGSDAYLWIATLADNQGASTSPDYPANMPDNNTESKSGTLNSDAHVACATVQSVASSFDPDAFTFLRDGVVHFTIAIPPPGEGTPGEHAVTGTATVGSLATTGTTAAEIATTGTATLGSLATTGTIAYDTTTSGTATLGALATTGTISSEGTGQSFPVTGTASLGSLGASGTIAASWTTTGTATIGSLATTGTTAAAKAQTGTATLGSLATTGTVAAHIAVTGTADIGSLATTGTISSTAPQSHAVAGTAALGSCAASGTITYATATAGTATVGDLATDGSIAYNTAVSGTLSVGSLALTGTVSSEGPTGYSVAGTAVLGTASASATVAATIAVLATAQLGSLAGTLTTNVVATTAGTASIGTLSASGTITGGTTPVFSPREITGSVTTYRLISSPKTNRLARF